jgi:hypothetical protein
MKAAGAWLAGAATFFLVLFTARHFVVTSSLYRGLIVVVEQTHETQRRINRTLETIEDASLAIKNTARQVEMGSKRTLDMMKDTTNKIADFEVQANKSLYQIKANMERMNELLKF